jgi:hypothetical protein
LQSQQGNQVAKPTSNPATTKLPLDRIPDHAQAHIPFLEQPPAQTELLITFEDLPLVSGDFVGDVIPNQYQSFTWTGWGQIYDAQKLREGSPVPSGYVNADASQPQVLIGLDLSDPSISSDDGGEFDFQSGHFTSAWSNGATMTVTGYKDGLQVAEQSFTIDTSASDFIEFSSAFNSVDSVTFHSEGGVLNGFGVGNNFLVDDLLFLI